jgi:nucleotide-binding universal stress UspA family protein
MIKDLIVNLSVAPIRDVAGNFAVSVAAAFEADVAGVAFVYEPAPPMLTMGTIPADLLSRWRNENESAATAAVATFDSAARRAGVSAETHAVDTTFLGASDYFARAARRFDLAVVGQAEPGKIAPEELIAEAALFDSGRPVVVVPYIQKAGLKLDRVMVCWDAGRNAARAIADAMPFLARAKAIDIVIVAKASGKDDELAGADIAQHLARHGLHVEVQRIFGSEMDVADTILSRAADSSADFIVMGGYGHSRLREFILGGATRGILTAMTVPTLLSH